jgi:hypothetical protein
MMNALFGEQIMAIKKTTLATFALTVVAGFCCLPGPSAQAAGKCDYDSAIVAARTQPVPLQRVQNLPPNADTRQILLTLGPAARDVGSGVFVLQWDVSNGQVFSVSTSGPCAAPIARRLIDAQKPRQ